MRVKLTKRYCDSVTYDKTPPTLDVRWDDDVHGFGLRVYPSGRKSWVIYYRSAGARQRLYSLAPYARATLEEARRLARGELGRVAQVRADPAAERHAAREGDTVEELVEVYLRDHARPRKRTWKEDERQLRKDLVPLLGSRKVSEVTRSDVRALVESVARRGSPIAANRLLAVLRTMFGFAVDREMIEHSPTERLKPPGRERRRERVLTEQEIRTVWTFPGETGRALRLTLATGQRPGEVCGASWGEVEGSWWTIPQGRAKTGRGHRVPLSGLAEGLLGPRRRGWVFPAPTREGHLSLWTLDHAVTDGCKELGLAHFTPHDLRRTCGTGLGSLGVPPIVISRILGHSEGGTTSIYNRHTYDSEKRDALLLWERHLGGLLLPG